MTEHRENTLPKVTLLTVADVAGYFGVTRMTIYRWVNEGRLPARQIGRTVRIDEEDVKALLASSVIQVDHPFRAKGAENAV